MAEIKGTKTEKNLNAAFAGESQARVKYQFYASKAKKEGYEQIAAIFTETSDNEKEHAKIWYKILHDGGVPDTKENLKDAIAGEEYEETEMYVKFAAEAREEGFEEIAKLFEEVGKIEAEHEKRYRKLLDNLEKGIVFKGDGVTVWKCRNCGYIHIGDSAPEECPVCKHPQAYFEIQAENY
ncbi:rubrerythrin family protein [Candidatus Saccharibacteria bacterium]|nr:rubrerythrin family protein [Candidatus Saccharibacteria bacterium]MBP5656015.1 rubrerythrin family protein [Candidatus Saccharibacteria bacterium]